MCGGPEILAADLLAAEAVGAGAGAGVLTAGELGLGVGAGMAAGAGAGALDTLAADSALTGASDAAMGNWLTAPEAVSTASPLAEVAGSGLSGLDPLEYAMQQSGFEYLPEAQSFGAPVASATPTYAAEPIDEGSLWENISTPFKQANSMLDQALNTPEARLMQRAGQAKSLYDKLQGPDTSALERMQQQLQAYRTTGQQSQSFNPSREFGYANFNPRYGRI